MSTPAAATRMSRVTIAGGLRARVAASVGVLVAASVGVLAVGCGPAEVHLEGEFIEYVWSATVVPGTAPPISAHPSSPYALLLDSGAEHKLDFHAEPDATPGDRMEIWGHDQGDFILVDRYKAHPPGGAPP